MATLIPSLGSCTRRMTPGGHGARYYAGDIGPLLEFVRS
jgi:hypothetical protein